MSQSDDSKIVFGYWALRGKAHVIRLLMEHLKIPYQDVIYKTPQAWYQDTLAKPNGLVELPYIRDKDFTVDETIPVLGYVLKKYGHQNFLGVSIQDQASVDMHLWSMENVFRKVISMSFKQTDSVQELMQMKQDFWKRTLQPKLQSIQEFLIPDNWYLGYLSVIDFDLYQLVHYLRILYPSKVENFPKIQMIEKQISKLPAIRAYNNSERCRSLCFLPFEMRKRFKTQSQTI